MDAFVIRSTLVPAFMRLAGEANWWAPAWMRRIHDRIGISETVDLTDPDDPPSGGGARRRAGRRARPRTPTATRPGSGDRQVSPPGRSRSRRGEGDRLRAEILASAEDLLVETASEDAVSIRAVAERGPA